MSKRIPKPKDKPLPWRFDVHGFCIVDAENAAVPYTSYVQRRIVRAVNSHADLLAALEVFIKAFGPIERVPQPVPPFKEGDTYPSPAGNMIPAEVAEQAIAAVDRVRRMAAKKGRVL